MLWMYEKNEMFCIDGNDINSSPYLPLQTDLNLMNRHVPIIKWNNQNSRVLFDFR